MALLSLNLKSDSSVISPYALPELHKLLSMRSETTHHDKGPTSLQWMDLVEAYARCDLIRDSDKLIAVSGIAQKILTTTKQAWCAGIWEDQLCQELLWFPKQTG
jgi:hypothetical protein